jgi:hypothetical protein
MSDEDFQNLDYISLIENVKPKPSNDKEGENNFGLVYLYRRIACDRNKLSEKRKKRKNVNIITIELLSMLIFEVR